MCPCPILIEKSNLVNIRNVYTLLNILECLQFDQNIIMLQK